jgi:hypothetical protein
MFAGRRTKCLSVKNNDCDCDEIWRDELKEHRGSYYVTYQPPDSRWNFALVDLVFHGKQPEASGIRRAMEQEIKLWLTRFRVPVMSSSFDATETVIHLPKEDGGSMLMAYIDPRTAQVVHRWSVFEDDEMPAEQMTSEHFSHVYRDVPFRRAKAVREAADIEHRKLRVAWYRMARQYPASNQYCDRRVQSWEGGWLAEGITIKKRKSGDAPKNGTPPLSL